MKQVFVILMNKNRYVEAVSNNSIKNTVFIEKAWHYAQYSDVEYEIKLLMTYAVDPYKKNFYQIEKLYVYE